MPQVRPLPNPIEPGARLGVFALSGPIHPGSLGPGIRWLREAGFEVICADNVASRTGYLAGDDDARIAALDRLLDRKPDALIAARGGYGAMRVLERIPWTRLAEWGGWIVGFSDLTAVHAAGSRELPFATLHAAMITGLPRHEPSARSLVAWLTGRRHDPIMRIPRSAVVRGGNARGVSTGGNLAMLAALAGSDYAPDLAGTIVFLEDVNEPGYRLDRELTQLALSTRLGRAKAIVVGRLERCGQGERGWRMSWRRRLLDLAGPAAVIVDGLSFGHGRVNCPFPIGVEVEVDTGRGAISWGGRTW